jgi:hypothetical protein
VTRNTAFESLVAGETVMHIAEHRLHDVLAIGPADPAMFTGFRANAAKEQERRVLLVSAASRASNDPPQCGKSCLILMVPRRLRGRRTAWCEIVFHTGPSDQLTARAGTSGHRGSRHLREQEKSRAACGNGGFAASISGEDLC